MFKRVGIVALATILIFMAASVVVIPTSNGWVYPSDKDERVYYPGSDYYPVEFYKLYSEKYVRVYVRDIILNMPYGHHVKVGTLVFTIIPITNKSGDASTTILSTSREYLLDIEIVYNAGSYIRDEPAVRYLDVPEHDKGQGKEGVSQGREGVGYQGHEDKEEKHLDVAEGLLFPVQLSVVSDDLGNPANVQVEVKGKDREDYKVNHPRSDRKGIYRARLCPTAEKGRQTKEEQEKAQNCRALIPFT